MCMYVNLPVAIQACASSWDPCAWRTRSRRTDPEHSTRIPCTIRTSATASPIWIPSRGTVFPPAVLSLDTGFPCLFCRVLSSTLYISYVMSIYAFISHFTFMHTIRMFKLHIDIFVYIYYVYYIFLILFIIWWHFHKLISQISLLAKSSPYGDSYFSRIF